MVAEEVENVRWIFLNQNYFMPVLIMVMYTVLISDRTLSHYGLLHAHDAGISSLDVNNYVPGMLITSAMGEKVVKLWKCPSSSDENNTTKTRSFHGFVRDFGVGNVLTTSYAPDIEVAGNVVIGGITGGLKMWMHSVIAQLEMGLEKN